MLIENETRENDFFYCYSVDVIKYENKESKSIGSDSIMNQGNEYKRKSIYLKKKNGKKHYLC